MTARLSRKPWSTLPRFSGISAATSLGPKLVQLGVVASSRAFVLAAEHSSNPAGLLPGFYGMHMHMQASLAYALLLNPKDLVQVTVTIPEGLRLSQTTILLGAKSGIPATAYAAALKNPASLGLPSYANGKAEGYLFPATYVVQPHETALGVLKGMVQRFGQEAATVNLPAAASQVHLSQSQVIIMASLVQAEGGRLSDYPKIARVIYNRLAQGIPLQLDSTVLYGLNTFGILANDQQLNSPSPYNTYRHKGLPPGPIDSPGNAAIQAVLHPATGELDLLRDRKPEDRRDPVHLERDPVRAIPARTPAQPGSGLTEGPVGPRGSAGKGFPPGSGDPGGRPWGEQSLGRRFLRRTGPTSPPRPLRRARRGVRPIGSLRSRKPPQLLSQLRPPESHLCPEPGSAPKPVLVRPPPCPTAAISDN